MNSRKTPNIFIVEDNRFYGELIKNELEQSDYNQIELHTSGDDCIANLYKMPDIVLLDYFLEGSLNGVEVLKKIKAFNPNIQVIMLSAQRELDVAINSLKYGAFDYVIKNEYAFQQMRVLLNKIEKWNQILAQKQARQKNKRVIMTCIGITLVLLLTLQGFIF